MQALLGVKIALIPQDPQTSLNPSRRIGDQLTDGLRLRAGMARTEAREKALNLLADVHIRDPQAVLHRYPHELSGGMRQRVLIAQAFSLNPDVIIADEPTTALDVTVQAQILELIGEQRRERNMSLVLVTHDLGVVAGHTDEIAVMYGGKLVEKAPTKRLFAAMKMPYTEALISAIPPPNPRRRGRPMKLSGEVPSPSNPPSGCYFHPRCAYATDLCKVERPPLREITPGHFAACHYSEKLTLRGIDGPMAAIDGSSPAPTAAQA